MSARRFIAVAASAVALLPLAPFSATAQLPNADPRALGLGGNFTALARGFAAVAWNPATLALADQPGFSITVAPVTAAAGLGPVTWRELGPFSADTVPAHEREQWLVLIEGEGEARLGAGGEVTLLAASLGRFGLQISTVARADATLTPGASELWLFGNTGRTGEPCPCPVTGSTLDAHAVTTGAISFGRAIGALLDGQAAAGVTLKYSVGHELMHSQNARGSAGPQPIINMTFPVVMTDTASEFGNTGSGVGIDLGFVLQRDDLTLGASLRNLIQTFSWNEAQLRYREARVLLSRQTQDADLPEAPFESAPAELRQFVEDRSFARVLSLGVSHDPNENLTVVGDVRARLGGSGMDASPGLHVGVGGELRWSRVSFRGGAAARSDGFQLGGGIGLEVGPARFALAVQRRETDAGTELGAMITLLSAAW